MLPTASRKPRRWLALGIVLVLLLSAVAAIGLGRRRLAPPVDYYLPATGPPAAPLTLTNLRAA